jgi:D-lactate dehydrogenase (cytochrome)
MFIGHDNWPYNQYLWVSSVSRLIEGELFESNGGDSFIWAVDLTERNKLWKARHNVLYAMLALRPGARV